MTGPFIVLILFWTIWTIYCSNFILGKSYLFLSFFMGLRLCARDLQKVALFICLDPRATSRMTSEPSHLSSELVATSIEGKENHHLGNLRFGYLWFTIYDILIISIWRSLLHNLLPSNLKCGEASLQRWGRPRKAQLPLTGSHHGKDTWAIHGLKGYSCLSMVMVFLYLI